MKTNYRARASRRGPVDVVSPVDLLLQSSNTTKRILGTYAAKFMGAVTGLLFHECQVNGQANVGWLLKTASRILKVIKSRLVIEIDVELVRVDKAEYRRCLSQMVKVLKSPSLEAEATVIPMKCRTCGTPLAPEDDGAHGLLTRYQFACKCLDDGPEWLHFYCIEELGYREKRELSLSVLPSL